MMHLTDITALAGIAFAITALTLRLPVISRLQAKQQAGFAALLFIAVLVPFGNLSCAELVRGVTGDLSIATLMLLAIAFCQTIQNQSVGASSARESLHCREQGLLLQNGLIPILIFVVIFALSLYPFALGIGTFDPYRLGFGNVGFVTALLLALVAWWRHYTLLALAVSLAVLAWGVGWYESNNLWDYLIDPWVSIYAIAALFMRLVWAVRKTI